MKNLQSFVKEYVNSHAMCLSVDEAFCIAEAIHSRPSASVLVFGLGNDSLLWDSLCKGEIVFLEDDLIWIDKITQFISKSKVIYVDYPSRAKEWKYLLDHENELICNMPEYISSKKWDIILVDGPLGNCNKYKPDKGKREPPGRMYSIYWASQVISNNGIVFVHDCCREIEKAYASRFIGDSNLDKEITNGYKNAILRKYIIRENS